MPMTADQSQTQTATLVDLGVIFVSLELSKSTWLVTALSPCSEKMSRHTIIGGDIAGLFSKERIARNAGRLKTPMIVALARKLLVALWKYVKSGVVIEGAIMKTA